MICKTCNVHENMKNNDIYWYYRYWSYEIKTKQSKYMMLHSLYGELKYYFVKFQIDKYSCI